MANKIKYLKINSLRGIKDFLLEDLGDVNLILGDNNSGKTTILEAIGLFKKNDFSNITDVLKNRFINKLPSFNDFVYLFNTKGNFIDIELGINNQVEKLYLDYNLSEITLSKELFLSNIPENEELNRIYSFLIEQGKIEGTKMPQIKGIYKYNDTVEPYSFIPFDFRYKINNINNKNNDLLKIVYESPWDHFKIDNNMISDIKRNESYYKIFIEVLRLFDPTINKVELLAHRNNIFDIEFPEIYIQCGDNDPTPISTHGDGIKKAICISAVVAKAVDGILLIDEIETSLHHNYYSDLLYFLIKVAKRYNIQLFITTHSKEIIDTFARYNKENSQYESIINFYTLKKTNSRTINRLLDDISVNQYNNLGLEVRD